MIFMFVNSMIENLKFIEKYNNKKIYIKKFIDKRNGRCYSIPRKRKCCL